VDTLLAAFVVRGSEASMVRLAVAPDSIEAWTHALRRPLVTRRDGRIDLARAPYDLALAHRLYRVLLEPLMPLIGQARRLVIVPDGALHFLPFDGLVTATPAAASGGRAAYDRAAYVVDRFEVVHLPSPRWVGGGRTPIPRDGRVLAVAYEAPGADHEAAVILRSWSGRASLLAEQAATEENLRRLAGTADVVHFASHATADGADPLRSHLRLAPSGADDGTLHMNEIARLSARSRLVVLSACETLSGRLYPGDGIMSLARAFLAGGAGAVVASHWPVGPGVAGLMEPFYQRLAGGDDPVAALRAAKLVLRADPERAHPFHWAGFAVVAGPYRLPGG